MKKKYDEKYHKVQKSFFGELNFLLVKKSVTSVFGDGWTF